MQIQWVRWMRIQSACHSTGWHLAAAFSVIFCVFHKDTHERTSRTASESSKDGISVFEGQMNMGWILMAMCSLQ